MLIIKNYPKKISIKRLVILAIFISFIAKLIVGYALRDSFFQRGNSHGPLNSIAFNLADRLEYAIEAGIPSIDYEPLYPFMLAACYKVFGKNWLGVTLMQGILFAGTSWLLFLIGAKIKDEITGLIAAIYHSFYPILFFHSLSVFDTTQFIFIIFFLFYLLLSVKNRNDYSYLYYCLIGGLLGLSFLSRGSSAAFWPPVFLYLFLVSSKLDQVKKFGIVIIIALVIMSPWLIRNYSYTRTIIISSHGGFGLWQGNNEYSYDYLNKNISLDEIYRKSPRPEIYKKFPIKPRPPKEAIAVAKKYTSEAIHFIRKDKKAFLQLCWLKFKKFWSWVYNPISSEFAFGEYKIRQTVYFISYTPLLLGLPFGLFYLFKISKPDFILIFSSLVSYTALHMVVIGFTRARLPLDPLLIVLFAIFISNMSGFLYSIANVSKQENETQV